MRREPRRRALRVDLHLGADGPPGAGRARGNSGQIERLEAAGIGTSRGHLASLPLDGAPPRRTPSPPPPPPPPPTYPTVVGGLFSHPLFPSPPPPPPPPPPGKET